MAGQIGGFVQGLTLVAPPPATSALPAANPTVPGIGPYTYTNSSPGQQEVTVLGTLTGITFSRSSVNSNLALGAAVVILNPGDSITLTYVTAPIVTVIQLNGA